MGMSHEQFADLSDFETHPSRPDRFDAESGEFERYRAHSGTGRYVIMEGAFGYGRCSSVNPAAFETEQDIFSIDYIEATPGQGLGTAALRQLVLEALASGIHAARMHIVEPRAIDMIERLHDDSLVLAAYYRMDHSSSLHPETPTDHFHEQPDICGSVEARAFLHDNEQTARPEEQGSVDCAIWF